jgi:hypothetical protein
MGSIIIDSSNVGVLGSDEGKRGPCTTSNIHQVFGVLEAMISSQHSLHVEPRLLSHPRVEDFVDPWIVAGILEKTLPVSFSERFRAVAQNRRRHMMPWFYENTI